MESSNFQSFYTTDQGEPIFLIYLNLGQIKINWLKCPEMTEDDGIEIDNTPALKFALPETCALYKSIGYNYGQRSIQDDGFSALLSLRKGNYLFIGPNMYVFRPKAPISFFYLNRGNSGVELSYAFDIKGNFYMLWNQELITSTAIYRLLKFKSRPDMLNRIEDHMFDLPKEAMTVGPIITFDKKDVELACNIISLYI